MRGGLRNRERQTKREADNKILYYLKEEESIKKKKKKKVPTDPPPGPLFAMSVRHMTIYKSLKPAPEIKHFPPFTTYSFVLVSRIAFVEREEASLPLPGSVKQYEALICIEQS